MTEFVDSTVKEIDSRLTELKQEVGKLEAARAALVGTRRGPGRPPGPATSTRRNGGSFVCDPFGEVLAEASHSREETLLVECDPRRIEEVRRNWPFLRDRRIDAYGGILKRVID